METEETKTETALIVLPDIATDATFKPANVNELLASLKTAALSISFDCSTIKGQKECRSHAFLVTKSKKHLVSLANNYIIKPAGIVKEVTTERIRIEKICDALRDEVKKPAVEQEAKEQARKDGHREKIELLKGNMNILAGASLSDLGKYLARSCDYDVESFEEFKPEVEMVKADLIAAIEAAITTTKEAEAQAEKLDRLERNEVHRNHITIISQYALGLSDMGINGLNQRLDDLHTYCINRDFEDFATEADETRVSTIKEIESAIKAEETRLQLVADNQKLKDAAQKVADDIIAASKAKDAADQKIIDDKQAVIDAAKLAEEQEEDAVWNNAHVEYDYRQSVKNEQAETKRIEEEKATAAKETARLASEDKQHRAEVIDQSIRSINDASNGSISLDQATEIVDLIAAGFIANIRINF